jgi:hypothetical protein
LLSIYILESTIIFGYSMLIFWIIYKNKTVDNYLRYILIPKIIQLVITILYIFGLYFSFNNHNQMVALFCLNTMMLLFAILLIFYINKINIDNKKSVIMFFIICSAIIYSVTIYFNIFKLDK